MVRQGRPLNVTDTELAVLKALWEYGPLTIRQLTDLLYPSGGTSHYATVQKLLERLKKKACVKRRLQGRLHVYSAVIDRPELIAKRLRETADKLCEGSLTPLLSHLVSARELSKEELAALRDLVERLDRDASARRGTS